MLLQIKSKVFKRFLLQISEHLGAITKYDAHIECKVVSLPGVLGSSHVEELWDEADDSQDQCR